MKIELSLVSPTPDPPLAVRLVTPHQHADYRSLVTAMHSLVLDQKHPVALEITRTGPRRSFQVRAIDASSLSHALAQLRTRYPQADIVPLVPRDDPLHLDPDETISVWELVPGAAPYLPLQAFTSPEEKQEAEHDPLLNLLAALDGVPEEMRAICQIALAPAPATWSRHFQRKALEPALEPEKQQRQEQQRQATFTHTTSMRQAQTSWLGSAPIFSIGVVLFLLAALGSWLAPLVPTWIQHAGASLLRGERPSFTLLESLVFYGTLFSLPIGAWLFSLWIRWLVRLQAPLYDLRLVASHTSRVAYRARLRLIVIGPQAAHLHPHQPAPTHGWTWASLRSRVSVWKQQGIRGILRAVKHQWRAWDTAWTLHRQRQVVLESLVAAYRAFHLPGGNYFRAHRCSWHTSQQMALRPAPVAHLGEEPRWSSQWSRGVNRSRMLLSVDVLAALWHLPPAVLLADLSGIEQRRARTRLIPPSLVEATGSAVPMGYSMHAGHQIPFRIPASCLTQHLLILGKSGEGKSTCQEHLAVAAMEQGGLVVIDPHGDLVEHVLRLVPAHRLDDVILLDLADPAFAFGFNPLDATVGRGRDKAISDLLQTLSHLWTNAWGPRMENAFEYALRTLYEANRHMVEHDATSIDKQYTLLDVMAILTDESFCHSLLDQIEDPFIKRWWYLYFDPLSQDAQRQRSDPVLSKVAKFENQIARRIIGQSQSSLHFPQAIQQEKIVLIKLAKGEIGEDMARLLGATFLGFLQIALQEQGNQQITARKRLGILVDEFQTLSGVDWAQIAELRKYGATFYLATQSLEYLREIQTMLLPVVLANVKQYILFHMSAQDAETMAAEIGVEPEDLVHLDQHQCYLSLRHAGTRLPPFSATFALPSRQHHQQAEAIRQRCRQEYMQPAEVVDASLKDALVRALAAQPNGQARSSRRTLQAAQMNTPHGKQHWRARQDGGYRGGTRTQQDRPDPVAQEVRAEEAQHGSDDT